MNRIGLEKIANNLYPRSMSNITTRKLKILKFFNEFGLKAAVSAFSVSKTSIYRWKTILDNHGGRIEYLNNKSTRPRSFRISEVNKMVIDQVLSLRKLYPTLGKDKLKPLIDRYCNESNLGFVSISTIGRIISHLKEKRLLTSNNKYFLSGKTGQMLLRRKLSKKKKIRKRNYVSTYPGDLLQIDTIIKFKDGLKRYIVTAIDNYGKFSFAYTYSTASSINTRDFLDKLMSVIPFKINAVQTDNGSEFEMYFDKELTKRNIPHYYTYPRCPKMNAYVERFNRTIQEEFIDFNINNLFYDLEPFNEKLMDWLLWYNTKRPHYSLKQLSPIDYLIKHLGFSQMLWTHTCP
jgi:transposase InsO family protein